MWSDCILIRFETESQASELTTLVLMCQIFDGTLLSLTMMSYNMEPCRFYSWMQNFITINPLLSKFTLCSATILSLSDNNHSCVIRGQIWRPWSSRPGWSTTVPPLSSLTPSSASRSRRSRSSSLQWRYVCLLTQRKVTGWGGSVLISWWL